MVADVMPGFNPTLPEQSWKLISRDSDGPIEINVNLKKDETLTTIKDDCGHITTLKTVEAPDKGIWEVAESRPEEEKPYLCKSATIYFNGKFYKEINGLGVMPIIESANQLSPRERSQIRLYQAHNKGDQWDWFKISREFRRLEKALRVARLAEITGQPNLF